MKILVTGGAGFIGSNFIRWMLNHHPEVKLVNLDKLTYAGNLENLRDIEKDPSYTFLQGDVSNSDTVKKGIRGCAAVVHFAAETHVDRSIVKAADFIQTNLVGTHLLLEAAREVGVERYLQISTDEVYGSILEGAADEEGQIRPNSPYAASKAGADHLVQAYHVTYKMPTLILRASNNYGPYQFPEKFLPLMITNTMEGEPLPIYGDGRYVREWLFVEDFCEAIDLVLRSGQFGNIYNVGSGEHRVNLDVAQLIVEKLGKPKTLLRHVTDRPGHDRRYAIVSNKIRELGWAPRHRFEEGLEATIRWYQAHEEWWRTLKSKLLQPSRS